MNAQINKPTTTNTNPRSILFHVLNGLLKSEHFSYLLEDYVDGPPVTPNEAFEQDARLLVDKWRKQWTSEIDYQI